MMLVSNESEELTHTEKWYGTQYSTKPFDKDFVTYLKNGPSIPELRFPSPNPFIAKNFNVEKRTVENVSIPYYHQMLMVIPA